ncbi:hypothetical protein [Erythrobacter alti]|uniref:hypothetical protein n=1 Tax=Erythrobacter alti TaxID=1896145 RepID=UPI0030F3B183
MFGLFGSKPAPEGPAQFEAVADVDCSAETMFGLLDLADARYWKRNVGSVENVAKGRFRLHVDMVPDHAFTVVVTDAEPARLYAFDSQATPRLGRLVQTHERYEIVPTGDDACQIRLLVKAQFEIGMTMREWKRECEMTGIGVANALTKLKIHAEMGVEAIRGIEEIQRAA